jgi:O-phosphoseryl-tRNA(Cys) synthetase
MIEILKSYFTKSGVKVVVLEFRNGKYLCSDNLGNKFYLDRSELLIANHKKKVVEPEYIENNRAVSFLESFSTKITEKVVEPDIFSDEKKLKKVLQKVLYMFLEKI